MQLLVPAALALLTFNVAGPQRGTKPVPPLPKPTARAFAGTSDALRGLKGIYVFSEGLPSDAESLGLNKLAIVRRVVPSLRKNGIRTYTLSEQTHVTGSPALYINVNVHGEAFSISLQCLQDVRSLVTPGVELAAVTVWDKGTVGTHGGSAEYILDTLEEITAMFAADYLKANPPRK